MVKNARESSPYLPPVYTPGQAIRRVYESMEDCDTAGFVANTATTSGKFSETASAAEWKVTVIDGGADNGEALVVDATRANGWWKITTNDADNDAMELQKNGASVTISATKTVEFWSNIEVTDADTTDFFVGLAIPDTTVMAGVTDYIGFFVANGASSQVIRFGVAKNGSAAEQGSKTAASTTVDGETDVSTGITVTDATEIRLHFIVDGLSTITAYINGAQVAQIPVILDSSGNVQNFPDDVYLTKSISVRNNSAAAHTFYVDNIDVIAGR